MTFASLLRLSTGIGAAGALGTGVLGAGKLGGPKNTGHTCGCCTSNLLFQAIQDISSVCDMDRNIVLSTCCNLNLKAGVFVTDGPVCH